MSIRAVASLAVVVALTACVSTPQPDGSVKRSFSLDSLFKDKAEAAQPDPAAGRPAMAVAPVAAPVSAPLSTARAGKTAAIDANAGASVISAKAKGQLQQALSCITAGKSFAQAETVLRQIGWTSSQGQEPLELPEAIRVFGLSVSKIAITREGSVHTYRSYLPEVTEKRLIKAAALKLDKDTNLYSRATKLGKLEAGTDGGETTLTCTVKGAAAAY